MLDADGAPVRGSTVAVESAVVASVAASEGEPLESPDSGVVLDSSVRDLFSSGAGKNVKVETIESTAYERA